MSVLTEQLNRTTAPLYKDATEFDLKLKPYEKYILDNGVEIYAVNAGTQEVMSLELVFKAGNWYEQQNNVAAARTAQRIKTHLN